MIVRTALLTLLLLAGCASSAPEPVPSAASMPAPGGTTASPTPPSHAAATPRYAVSSRPSDWALAVVGTPFVLGFRAVVCTASVAVAAPIAAVFAVSEDPHGGFDYLRDGLTQNCGPPYVVPIPVYDRARAPHVGYTPAPNRGPPRRLTPYTSAAVVSP
jgi:hypothetical protein